MIDTLKKISQLAIELEEKQIEYSSIQINNTWIGFQPATEIEIEKAEERLGVKLPIEFKKFLLITNGFSQTEITEPEFFSIENVDWLKNKDKELIDIWKENGIKDVAIQLERAILIADSNREQHFLLIPPSKTEEWKYWKFASWIPGEEEYETLETYFNEVHEFLTEIKIN